jgi:signal transduction histidine kinase
MRERVGETDGETDFTAALLTLAHSENGEVERVPADLAQTAAAVLHAAATAAEQTGVTLHADLLAAPPQGDPVLLEQLARSLLDNAVRYRCRPVTGRPG